MAFRNQKTCTSKCQQSSKDVDIAVRTELSSGGSDIGYRRSTTLTWFPKGIFYTSREKKFTEGKKILRKEKCS